MDDVRKTFHDDLRHIHDRVVRLMETVAGAVERATRSVVDADLTLAEEVIIGDTVVDQESTDIEEESYLCLATQQPVAGDLRALVTAMRAAHELERVGDLAVNIAKATRRLYPLRPDGSAGSLIKHLGERTVMQLHTAASAFRDGDTSLAAAVVEMDSVIDELIKELFRRVVTGGAADELALQRTVQIALVGRYYERIGDHAANVASRVAFIVDGRRPLADHGLGAR